MQTGRVVQARAINDLLSADGLDGILGPVDRVSVEPLPVSGFSGAQHRRVTVRMRAGPVRRFVLKITETQTDWTAYRTNDTVGREAAILLDGALDGIWDAFVCPYIACAAEGGRSGLLMHDLTGQIAERPDGLTPQEEARIARAFARLHARFWNAPPQRPWLNSTVSHISILRPGCWSEETERGVPNPVFERVHQGWQAVLTALPPYIREAFVHPETIVARFQDLPQTLLHGDPRLANLALVPKRAVAAFDWACAGPGPALLDVYQYIGINWNGLTRGPDEFVARYFSELEEALAAALSPALRARLCACGVAGAAAMTLWTKGAVAGRAPVHGDGEWGWWLRNLEHALAE